MQGIIYIKKTSESGGNATRHLLMKRRDAGWQLVCFIIKHRTYVCKGVFFKEMVKITAPNRFIVNVS
ncbi:hypothetical protein AN935_07185 [Bacillus inaquosorum]|nr:hypothetical protein AN935_07185 [Bacillus inaquosorum]